MYFSILLIILTSVQTIFCLQSNITVDSTCNICTISWLRRKRAQEYTRWRTNQVTTPEFIVKVLDDDLTTLRTQKIVAVNIQPLTKNEKKIIIGGALVSLTTTLSTVSGPKDYTRFIPPTTIPPQDNTNVRSLLDKSIIMSPKSIKSENQKSHKKHVLRDESPPSGPQFLGRAQAPVAARQYAPVTPVSFNRGKTALTPLTPKLTDRFIYKTSNSFPTRTSPLPDVIKPSRTTYKTTIHDIFLYDRNTIFDDPMLVTHSSISEINEPHKTSRPFEDADESFVRPTEDSVVNWRKNLHDQKNIENKESDISYNMLFSNYDENTEKNAELGDNDNASKSEDVDKEYILYERPLPDFSSSNHSNKTLGDINESENSTDSSYYIEEGDDLQNITLKNISTIKKPMIDRKSAKEVTRSSHKNRNKVCSMIKLRQLNFNSPRTLPEIVAQLKQWAESSPVAKWVDITNGNYTTMENPIYMMMVDDPSSGQIISAKKTVLLIAGIQGRDHHAVAAAMYVLYQLIERSEAHTDLLTKYRFWVIPIFNPDGYDYSMTFPHRREWTKNLRQKWDSCKGRESCEACESFGLRCTVQPCYGVNLDRNFEYQWIPTEELRAEHPCGALYAGERQLSEAETLALTHFLHERRAPLFTVIAFKEGDVLGILYPYSHTRKRRAFDSVYRQRASRAASAAYSIGGRPYVAGQTSEFLPLYAGGIEDWVDGHLGIDDTYTVMMFRPTDSYNSKLITERVVHEAYAAMDTLLLQSAEPLSAPAATLATAAASLPLASPTKLFISIAPISWFISR